MCLILPAVKFAAGCVLPTLICGGAAGWICFGIMTLGWAILMGWQRMKLKKAADNKAGYKAKRSIALIMLGAIVGFASFVPAFLQPAWCNDPILNRRL